MSWAGRPGLMSAVPPSGPPYPAPFTDAELLTIEAALQIAWRRVVASVNGATADEVTFTVRLADVLDALMNDPAEPVQGFSCATFETVIRGGEVTDYKAERVEKRPDLVLRRSGRTYGIPRTQWGLFVECKIVDKAHSMSRYCRNGLSRFVEGSYAWAVGIAMMIGYARDAYTVDLHLRRHLRAYPDEYGFVKDSLAVGSTGSVGWCTRHERAWSYVSPHTGSPGPIAVTHIWLPVN